MRSSTSKAAALSAVLIGITSAQTPGCVSLRGSTQCPSFQDAYINPTNLSSAWPWMSAVTDVASFDSQFAQYFTDPTRFIQTKFVNQLQCNESAIYNTTLQWERTILCGQFSQISYSAQCNIANQANFIMVCQNTCLQYSASEHDATSNAAICEPQSAISAAAFTTRNNTLLKDYVTCTDWTSLVSTNNGTCVEGVTNEPNCGYGPGVSAQLCSACDPTGNVTVSSCCFDQKTDLSACANYGHPGAAAVRATGSAAPGFVSATSTGGASPTGGASAGSNASNTVGSTGLSSGALAGIIIGSIIGALILGALLALLLFGLLKKRRNRDNEASRGLVYGGGRSSTGDKPWNQSETGTQRSVGESPLDAEKGSNGSPGSGPHSKLAGAGAAGAGALGGAALLGSAGSSPQARPDSQLSSGTNGSDGRGTTVPEVRDQYTGQMIVPGEQVIAIFPYTAALNDELTLAVDDKVTVLKLFDDSWLSCRSSKGQVGMIPLVCVSSMKGDVPGRRNGTGTGTSDGDYTSGAEYSSSVENAVTADEGYQTARSARSG